MFWVPTILSVRERGSRSLSQCCLKFVKFTGLILVKVVFLPRSGFLQYRFPWTDFHP